MWRGFPRSPASPIGCCRKPSANTSRAPDRRRRSGGARRFRPTGRTTTATSPTAAAPAASRRKATVAVTSFAANPWGLTARPRQCLGMDAGLLERHQCRQSGGRQRTAKRRLCAPSLIRGASWNKLSAHAPLRAPQCASRKGCDRTISDFGLSARSLSFSAAAASAHTSTFSAAMNASCGISTFPYWRIFFLPSFCLSRSLRLRVMSPP